MHCPFCNHDDTKVTDSRLAAEGRQVRRRRECRRCGERYTTFESAVLVMPRVVKRDGRREPFDESKLRNGIARALEKRPIESEAVEGEHRAPVAPPADHRRARSQRPVHRRHGHGGTAWPRPGGLRAIRVGLPQFSGHLGVPRGGRAPAIAAAAGRPGTDVAAADDDK